jgi:HK97 gp10 family phage protein
MADSVRVEIKGLAQIRANMLELPKRVDRNLLNRGLLTGARLVRDDARARVPLLQVPDPRRVRGAIRRAIVAGRVRPEGYAAKVWVRVRPLTRTQIMRFKRQSGKDSRNNPNDPYYWAFVEFGTSKMGARPFMRPAFEGRKFEAVKKAIDVFRTGVQTEIARLGQRGGGR